MVAVGDAVKLRPRRGPCGRSGGQDHALAEFHHALGADQHAGRRAGDVAAEADRQVDAGEMPSVKASSTWVSGRVGPSTRTEGTSPPRPDDHHRLFRRVEARLVEVLGDGELVSGAEEGLRVGLAEVEVAGGDADDEVRIARRTAHLPSANLADDPLDQASIHRCGNAHGDCWVSSSSPASATSK